MKKHIYLVLALATLAGCGDKNGKSRPDNFLAGNDFEEIEGWNGDAPLPVSLTREKAHSGIYSMRVGPDVEYASGFIGTVGKISPTRLTKIKIKGWVFVPAGQPGGAIVTQVIDPDKQGASPLLWEALSLETAVKKRAEWVEIEKTLTMPANLSPTNKLYMYLWRGASPTSVAYIDDMEILRAE
ncbi:hypothetical protein GCM10028824_39230 [Hymenobacter segetis]|uniref:CBM-cenC domain-containing protein n=1 Tax=Hymenobacter segetis TaxID=2025509 RepID=A0ABU9M0T0_9BACT